MFYVALKAGKKGNDPGDEIDIFLIALPLSPQGFISFIIGLEKIISSYVDDLGTELWSTLVSKFFHKLLSESFAFSSCC